MRVTQRNKPSSVALSAPVHTHTQKKKKTKNNRQSRRLLVVPPVGRRLTTLLQVHPGEPLQQLLPVVPALLLRPPPPPLLPGDGGRPVAGPVVRLLFNGAPRGEPPLYGVEGAPRAAPVAPVLLLPGPGRRRPVLLAVGVVEVVLAPVVVVLAVALQPAADAPRVAGVEGGNCAERGGAVNGCEWGVVGFWRVEVTVLVVRRGEISVIGYPQTRVFEV